MISCSEPSCQHPLAGLTPVQHYNIYHRRAIFVADVWIARSMEDGLFHCAREGCLAASPDAEVIKVHYEVCEAGMSGNRGGEEWGVRVGASVGSERLREG